MSRKQLLEDDASQYDSINLRLRRLEQGIPEDFHYVGVAGEPAFQNSWVNFGGAYQTVAFRKDRGAVYFVGTARSGALSSTMFVLPAEYRPSADRRMAISLLDNTSLYRVALLFVTSSGVVQPWSLGATSPIAELHIDAVMPL